MVLPLLVLVFPLEESGAQPCVLEANRLGEGDRSSV